MIGPLTELTYLQILCPSCNHLICGVLYNAQSGSFCGFDGCGVAQVPGITLGI